MIDKSRDRNKKGTIPAFTPVPRRCRRHDGWTAARQRGFIEALADLGSVRAAANTVNMTPESAYQLRRHPEAGAFRKAWEAALGCGVQRLEDVAMERALNGVETPVYHFGRIVGTRRRYNDRLLMFVLRNRAGKRFAADSRQGTDAVAKSRLEKLRKQWRAEWEEERRIAAQREGEEIIESINRKLDRMNDRRRAAMSPEVRALEDALRQAQTAEREAAAPALPAPERPEAEARQADGETAAAGPHPASGGREDAAGED
jgi:hypothetical protein